MSSRPKPGERPLLTVNDEGWFHDAWDGWYPPEELEEALSSVRDGLRHEGRLDA